jgi:hypothetical protein
MTSHSNYKNFVMYKKMNFLLFLFSIILMAKVISTQSPPCSGSTPYNCQGTCVQSASSCCSNGAPCSPPFSICCGTETSGFYCVAGTTCCSIILKPGTNSYCCLYNGTYFWSDSQSNCQQGMVMCGTFEQSYRDPCCSFDSGFGCSSEQQCCSSKSKGLRCVGESYTCIPDTNCQCPYPKYNGYCLDSKGNTKCGVFNANESNQMSCPTNRPFISGDPECLSEKEDPWVASTTGVVVLGVVGAILAGIITFLLDKLYKHYKNKKKEESSDSDKEETLIKSDEAMHSNPRHEETPSNEHTTDNTSKGNMPQSQLSALFGSATPNTTEQTNNSQISISSFFASESKETSNQRE